MENMHTDVGVQRVKKRGKNLSFQPARANQSSSFLSLFSFSFTAVGAGYNRITTIHWTLSSRDNFC